LQAVVGIAQMKKLQIRTIRKRAIYRQYQNRLSGIVDFIPTNLVETAPMFVDILTDNRDALQRCLAEHQIGSRKFYPPLHSQKAYGLTGHFPVSEDVSRRGLWLPSSTFLTSKQIDMVCDHICLNTH
jgi:perosamine synthetase